MTDLVRYCTRVKRFPSTSTRAIRMRAMRAYKAMKANEENVGLEIQSDDVQGNVSDVNVEGNISVDNGEGNISVDNGEENVSEFERSFEMEIDSSSPYHSPSSFSTRTESPTGTSYMDIEDIAEKLTKADQFRRKLANWALTVPQKQVTSLLRILHSPESISELHSLPWDARALVQTPRNAVSRPMGTCGWYHHFGVESSIIRTLNELKLKHIPDKLKLFIHVDGFQASRSSTGEVWPILGFIDEIGLNAPFAMGMYYGTGKPSDAN